MVTASYLSPGLQAQHSDALAAGVTVVNECGVDPGIDHFLAMECFDDAAQGGGKVESFISFCGGLPAPECSDNPLGYKFSWSPRGALLNMLSGARSANVRRYQQMSACVIICWNMSAPVSKSQQKL